MLMVPENSGLWFACGLGKIGCGEVHENAPLEFGSKKACRQRKMPRAALTMWECKRKEVREEFAELKGVENHNVFIPTLIADGSAPVPLLVRMVVWWAEVLERQQEAEKEGVAQKRNTAHPVSTSRVGASRTIFL
jgi:hypothetical protein